MGKVILERMNNDGAKKTIYKFVDGKFTESFLGLTKAARNAGTTPAGLSSYINKRIKKPTRIPANVEYAFTMRLPKKESE